MRSFGDRNRGGRTGALLPPICRVMCWTHAQTPAYSTYRRAAGADSGACWGVDAVATRVHRHLAPGRDRRKRLRTDARGGDHIGATADELVGIEPEARDRLAPRWEALDEQVAY